MSSSATVAVTPDGTGLIISHPAWTPTARVRSYYDAFAAAHWNPRVFLIEQPDVFWSLSSFQEHERSQLSLLLANSGVDLDLVMDSLDALFNGK